MALKPHVRWRAALAAFVVGALIASIVAIAWHGVDVRNQRRAVNNAKLESNAHQIARVDALAQENRDRVQQIIALTRANAVLVLRVCQVQNNGARSTNAIIAYFESISKQIRPGPETDAFWRAVPRPAVQRCTPIAPKEGHA